MKSCLITNDDGYQAAGIRALIAEMSKSFDLKAIAPVHQQSWMGKSISGHRDLTFEPAKYHEFDGYKVGGTPADCAQIGLHELYAEGEQPHCVVSGINHGSNIGLGHILSSGTVGAALEAAMFGVPAFASSLWKLRDMAGTTDLTDKESVEYFVVAAQITAKIVKQVMEAGFPEDTQVIGINVPYNATVDSPWVVTRPHSVYYGQLFNKQPDGLFRNTSTGELDNGPESDTDIAVLAKGCVSIVPIAVQLTSTAHQERLAKALGIPIAK